VFTINHEYRVDMIRHHDLLNDFNVLVVSIQRSQVGIGDGADRGKMDVVVYNSAEDRAAIVRADRYEVPATGTVVPIFQACRPGPLLMLTQCHGHLACGQYISIICGFAPG
jgi:hypothetical protein